MKRISSLLLVLVLAFSFILTSCGSEEKEVHIIDFTYFTVNEIINWSRRQNVSDKFDYYFDYNDAIEAGSFISSSLRTGEVIKDKVEIRISLGERITSGKDPAGPYNPDNPFNPGDPVSPFGPNPWEEQKVMPNVIGMDVEDAKAAINEKGFTGSISTVSLPSDQPKDTVINCSPFTGAPFSESKNEVTLYVSNGALANKAVKIDVPYSGALTLATVYVNGECIREFSTLIGHGGSDGNIVTIFGEGQATVRIVVLATTYSPDGDPEFYYSVDFTKGTYKQIANPDVK